MAMRTTRLATAMLVGIAGLAPESAGAGGQQPMSTSPIAPRQVLIDAVRAGREQQVAELLAGGADVAQRDPLGRTALHYAARLGQPATVLRLLEAGAAVDARDQAGFTPLMRAAQAGSANVAQLLLDHQADPGLRTPDGRQAADLVPEDAPGLERQLRSAAR
jgi:ankyrin repeat protein